MSQRIYKFRAWDESEKRMFEVHSAMFEGKVKRGITTNHSTNIGGMFYHSGDLCHSIPDSAPVMQFTGLLDKNGVEIWEGDVVKTEFAGTHQVKWDTEYAGFAPFCEQVFNAPDTYSEWSVGATEIIGNCYENPNLIEK